MKLTAHKQTRLLAALATLALGLMLALSAPSPATAGGGLSPEGEKAKSTKVKKAKLRKGKAIAPDNAPKKIKKIIRAANKIRNKPYRYGGGHASFKDSGYDCSGAVSYALRGARLIDAPRNSSGLADWGKRGKGRWLTVYGAGSHAYMVVAGLRFDTSMVKGDGPGWSKSLRSTPENYEARRWKKL